MPETAPATACLFCDLLDGHGELSVAASDAVVVAFMDTFPVAPGHVLVVPRRHVPSLEYLTAEEGTALWSMTQIMARRIRAQHAPAVNLHLSDGAEAEQDVPHVHMHVLPRHAGDAITIRLPGQSATRDQLDRVATSLAAD
ncbi:HIT family protein [Ornithinimicrobium cavernae]|uniref:HIT family protein n=1 Tax=Ornithinimicrobium cavernae TaxID=2666047 RepID=UPI000D68A87C|nr:HIT domain-containing protein [Ornithinimicrobium cavernae]